MGPAPGTGRHCRQSLARPGSNARRSRGVEHRAGHCTPCREQSHYPHRRPHVRLHHRIDRPNPDAVRHGASNAELHHLDLRLLRRRHVAANGRFSRPTVACGLGLAWVLAKPLNALLLGDGYARSMGVNVRLVRSWIIAGAAVLAGTVTAYCGPIGFLGNRRAAPGPHTAQGHRTTISSFLPLPWSGRHWRSWPISFPGAGNADRPSPECDHRPDRGARRGRGHPPAAASHGGGNMSGQTVLETKRPVHRLQAPQAPRPRRRAGRSTSPFGRASSSAFSGPTAQGNRHSFARSPGCSHRLSGSVFVAGDPLHALSARVLAKRMSLVLTERVAVGMMPVMSFVALGRHPYTNWMGRYAPGGRRGSPPGRCGRGHRGSCPQAGL